MTTRDGPAPSDQQPALTGPAPDQHSSSRPERPNLRLVNTETGEVHEGGCPDCFERDDVINGLQRDIRGWTARYADLNREKDAEARAHKLWPEAKRLFAVWRERCNHPRARWTPDRFWECFPMLRDDGGQMCELAIEGAAFDPFETTRKNGSVKRHDDWELIFRDRKHFEDFCNRAPLEVRQRLLNEGGTE
jgi:hypothetical protein